MDTLLGGVGLPSTWNFVEKIFCPVHRPPIILATCGACKPYCFDDPARAAGGHCGVLRFAPKAAPSQQQQQPVAPALRVVRAKRWDKRPGAARQFQALFAQLDFCDLMKSFAEKLAARPACGG